MRAPLPFHNTDVFVHEGSVIAKELTDSSLQGAENCFPQPGTIPPQILGGGGVYTVIGAGGSNALRWEGPLPP